MGIKCSKSLDAVDKKMAQAAGCSFLRLNGCPECRHHVHGQGDERTHCPHVNEKHEVCGKPRYDERGVPFEEVFYFPLIPRLRALLRTKQFRKLIQHEIERPCNPSILSHIYDSPAWKKFAGQAGSERIDRILLQFCIDGIPAFAAGTLSLKPAEFINLNLPPALRCKSENIMLFMLIPATLKHCKKYYDFAATYELNELYEQGVEGVKVRVFGTTMDTKGREELLGMQAIQSYQSCPVCIGEWSPGSLVGRKQCIFDGFRRFLPPTSRGRKKTFLYKGHEYQYRCEDRRPKPASRDEDFVRHAVYLATTAQPFAGHKSIPHLANWPGYGWYRMNTPEPMHDGKNACDNIMTTIVGHVSNAGKYDKWKKDAKHRKQSKTFGIFPEIWPTVADGNAPVDDNAPVDNPAGQATTDVDGNAPVDNNPADGEPVPGGGPLPWRLSKTNRLLLDERTKNIVWPRKMERLYYRGASMWKKPDRMWKCRRKLRLLYHIL